MHLLAHRGCTWQQPENTLAAFASALALGFTGIETDVRWSLDGEAILYHDRLSPRGQAVAALTRKELSHQAGFIVPSLSEALDAFPDAFWNIELKTPAGLPSILSTLSKVQDKTPILASSFYHPLIQEAANTLSTYLGLLFASRPLSLNTLLEISNASPKIKTLIWNFEILDPSFIDEARRLGFAHFVYGAANEIEHEWCRKLAIDGIITDYPEWVGLGSAPCWQ
ncbi:glycerophosphodiester phosphodiesterase [Deefgea piscis]|uniref:Glycerophosphodiester phosphodiesterase n=1 Tax=Deefgea piscis TaxID=2739061 RepID=A0A6M8SXD6_9NEIS|nr:glycerophosphodiester phosphodiesterase [Deefgea piscis]QKJ67910.1 glycerophosphodiester phosphodiesterase [Deefgea piscis]